MSDNGIQNGLEKLLEDSHYRLYVEQLAKISGVCSVSVQSLDNMVKRVEELQDAFVSFPPNMGRTICKDSISELEYQKASQELSDYAEQLRLSTDQQITTLKSQLKHCKNYLERQNIERKLNRLYKERR